jgi:aerobic-type carbon monoxide dehydrogenase small subunit (CoxS/CutS family)
MPDGDEPRRAGAPASDSGASGLEGVTRRAVIGGGGAVVAAGVVVGVGAATDWYGLDDSDGDKREPQAPTGPEAADGDSGYVPPGARTIALNVNGGVHRVVTTPDTMLLYVLRDSVGLHGPKFGCGLAQCGACAVLVDGRETRSCVTPVSAVRGRQVTTLEGLHLTYNGPRGDTPPELHPLQQAWIDEQVPQCGYCQAGMIIQAADLLSRTPHPSDEQIRQGMDPHLCRCGTHLRIIRAIKRAANEMAS